MRSSEAPERPELPATSPFNNPDVFLAASLWKGSLETSHSPDTSPSLGAASRFSPKVTCGAWGGRNACEMGAVLADVGQQVYTWVYAGSMVSVLVFGITKGLTFTKTTLMASSSLHDRVFDKVRPWEPRAPLGHPSTGLSARLQRARRGAGLRGQTQPSWSSLSSLGRVSKISRAAACGSSLWGAHWGRRERARGCPPAPGSPESVKGHTRCIRPLAPVPAAAASPAGCAGPGQSDSRDSQLRDTQTQWNVAFCCPGGTECAPSSKGAPGCTRRPDLSPTHCRPRGHRRGRVLACRHVVDERPGPAGLHSGPGRRPSAAPADPAEPHELL